MGMASMLYRVQVARKASVNDRTDFGKLAAISMAFLAMPRDRGESLSVSGGWLSIPVIPARGFSVLLCGTLVRRRHPATDETPLQLVSLVLQGREQ